MNVVTAGSARAPSGLFYWRLAGVTRYGGCAVVPVTPRDTPEKDPGSLTLGPGPIEAVVRSLFPRFWELEELQRTKATLPAA